MFLLPPPVESAATLERIPSTAVRTEQEQTDGDKFPEKFEGLNAA
jgi:hypothetical protein